MSKRKFKRTSRRLRRLTQINAEEKYKERLRKSRRRNKGKEHPCRLARVTRRHSALDHLGGGSGLRRRTQKEIERALSNYKITNSKMAQVEQQEQIQSSVPADKRRKEIEEQEAKQVDARGKMQQAVTQITQKMQKGMERALLDCKITRLAQGLAYEKNPVPLREDGMMEGEANGWAI